MKKPFLLFMVITIFVVGCTSVPPILGLQNEEEKWCIPSIGSEAIAYVGDAILKEGVETTTNTINLRETIGTYGWTAYYPQGNYKLVGISNRALWHNGEKVFDKEIVEVYQYPQKLTNGWDVVYPEIIKRKDGSVYLQSGVLLESTKYTEKKIIEEYDYYFEQLILFTGIEGDVLKFTYREFQNDLARPDFTVDVSYDMKKDKILRFRNCAFEVLDYDNQCIKYRLLSGFKTN